MPETTAKPRATAPVVLHSRPVSATVPSSIQTITAGDDVLLRVSNEYVMHIVMDAVPTLMPVSPWSSLGCTPPILTPAMT